MRKKARYTNLLILILLLVFSYFVMLFFTTFPSIFLGVIILWAIILPVLSYFPYSIIYILSIPAPIFGTWFLLMELFLKYKELSTYGIFMSPFLSVGLVLVFHMLTRKRTMFWRISKSEASRSSIAGASILFIFFGMIVLNPTALNLSTQSELFYFSVALFAYVASSMLYVNSNYRLFAISDRIGVRSFERKSSEILANIEKKFPNNLRNVDMLRYYFRESFYSYLDGDFERSFIWGYKVIREPTIVNPVEYINDKREEKQSLSDIRNTIEHSRRKGHVDTDEIKRIIRNLFDDCLDLLEREFEFITKVAGS